MFCVVKVMLVAIYAVAIFRFRFNEARGLIQIYELFWSQDASAGIRNVHLYERISEGIENNQDRSLVNTNTKYTEVSLLFS